MITNKSLRSRRLGRRFAVTVLAGLTVTVLAAGCGSSRAAGRNTGPSSTTSAPASASSLPQTRGGTLGVGSQAHSISFGGKQRDYRTYVPANLTSAAPAPLVVVLHGGFGSAKQAESSYGWDAEADAHGFVVAYPNGTNRSWNAGTCCGPPEKGNVDDVGFIKQVVSDVGHAVAIDPKRTFVTGMSNGAMMTERLACETKLFAAAASVAGAQMVRCTDPQPISMLHVHGLVDHHVPFDGSAGSGIAKVMSHTPVQKTIDAWRRVDDCAEPTVTKSGVVTRSTATCPEGRAVELITIADAGHQWPGETKSNPRLSKLLGADPPSTALNATDEIWAFFAAHPAHS